MKSIRQMIQGHDREIWSVAPDDSVQTAISMLVEKNIGALIVMQGDQMVGIVSERDCARKLLPSGRSPNDTPVSDIMSSNIISGAPENTIDECMALMTSRDIRHLPIVENDDLLCVVSLGELVRSIISEQQEVIDQLESYISS